MHRNHLFLVIFLVLIWQSCKKDHPEGGLTDIPYAPTTFTIQAPVEYPPMPIPADNPMTVEGVTLGRQLFFDNILSDDYTMSCASCHLPGGSFTDQLAVSTGIDGIAGKRSSMSLVDIGYATNGLFWDGRVATLEEQALIPVEDPIELHTTWPTVIERLQNHSSYPELFRKAFGIEHRNDITKELAARALAQFERSLVSSGDSRYDRWLRNEIEMTDEEFLGYVLFFDLDPSITDAECGHCHNAPLFTTNEYFNNGIEDVANIQDFPDPGREMVTGDPFDRGRFRVTTLRNIRFTAPYMHDGRFQTLEEVVDHYNSGGHFQPNKDPLIRPLGLLPHEKEALISFIDMLSDSTFLNDPDHQDPF